MNKLLATALVSIGLATAVPATLAQTAGAAADGGRGQSAQRQFERSPAMTLSERVEARLAYMRTALKITAGQQAQWDAYANVQRKHAAAMEKRFQERRAQMAQGKGTERKRPTAVERHQFQRDRMVAATQRLDELLTVEKPLYAALTPDQQRVADEVLKAGGRRHGGGGHHRGGRFGRA